MNIKLKCCCGAEIDIVDTHRCYAGNKGSSHMEDDKGRMYLSQVIADEWLDRHDACLKRNKWVAEMAAVKEDTCKWKAIDALSMINPHTGTGYPTPLHGLVTICPSCGKKIEVTK